MQPKIDATISPKYAKLLDIEIKSSFIIGVDKPATLVKTFDNPKINDIYLEK